MADEQEDVAVAQPASDTAVPVLVGEPFPAHLNPQWFDPNGPIPQFMAGNPNWMNISGSVDEPIYVRMSDGTVQKTTSPIHLGLWLLEQHATVIAAPKED